MLLSFSSVFVNRINCFQFDLLMKDWQHIKGAYICYFQLSDTVRPSLRSVPSHQCAHCPTPARRPSMLSMGELSPHYCQGSVR